MMQKYEEVFDGIKEIYMKMRFNTDDNISPNKIIYFPTITIIIRSVTQKDEKFYPQLFLDDCLYQV